MAQYDAWLCPACGAVYSPPSYFACVAQLVEQLTRNEQVAGSSPATSSKRRHLSKCRCLLFIFSFGCNLCSKKPPATGRGLLICFRLRLALLAHQSGTQQSGHAHDRQPQRHTGIAGSGLLRLLRLRGLFSILLQLGQLGLGVQQGLVKIIIGICVIFLIADIILLMFSL